MANDRGPARSLRPIRIVVASVVALSAALGVATLSGAQTPTRPFPPGGDVPAEVRARLPRVPQIPPPDADRVFLDAMVRGPDGEMRVDGRKVMLGKMGPDGELIKNPDGSVKLFPLSDGSLPPITPASAGPK